MSDYAYTSAMQQADISPEGMRQVERIPWGFNEDAPSACATPGCGQVARRRGLCRRCAARQDGDTAGGSLQNHAHRRQDTQCRHCLRWAYTVSRGLCFKCWSKDDIRALYPSQGNRPVSPDEAEAIRADLLGGLHTHTVAKAHGRSISVVQKIARQIRAEHAAAEPQPTGAGRE